MATVHYLLESKEEFINELQERLNHAEEIRNKNFKAAMVIIRYCRRYLIQKHVAFLSQKALIIQCAFRVFMARKKYKLALKRSIQNINYKYYRQAATRIQALWRGHYSRRTKFCYRTYRHWLSIVRERGERKAAEAAEFGMRSRADDLKILEEEARQWLAFVVFKLHHLLRTYSSAGVYSEPASTELSEFEKLLKSIHYTEYMKRLRRKYDQFVRKHRPVFSNKTLFPIIGDGTEYWYLSLPEMYELTSPAPKQINTRYKAMHHGKIHKEPFLWKRVRPEGAKEDRGPFNFTQRKTNIMKIPPGTPTPTLVSERLVHSKDPRFHLYVKHYKPVPALFEYVDYHVNILLRRKVSVRNIELDD